MNHRHATAALLLALLPLSACGSDPEPPATADTTSIAPSPTKTGPTEPRIPPLALQQSKAGAIAFAKYYWKVVDYAQASGDTRQLRSLQATSCRSCDGGTRWIEKISKRRGLIRGGNHLIRSVVVPDPGTINGARPTAGVVVRMRVTPQRIENAGNLNRRYAPGTDVVSMLLGWDVGAWTVTTWSVL